jgi:hypothetical protein
MCLALLLSLTSFNLFAGLKYVSPNGSNTNAGTEINPYLTISYAIQQAAEFDTVIMLPGVYSNSFDFSNKNITIASRFVLNSDSTEISQTIIDGSNFGGNNPMLFCNSLNTTFRLIGFTLRNTLSPAMVVSNRGNSIIRDCVFQNNGNYSLWATITIQGNTKVEDCVFRNNKGVMKWLKETLNGQR